MPHQPNKCAICTVSSARYLRRRRSKDQVGRGRRSQGCVIETKKIGASLLRYSSDTSNFESTLDQGMSYLDASDARSCIITNGHDWYAIWRTFDDERWQADGAAYFGARFRRAEIVENGDHLRLEHFLSMCNSYCLTEQANRSVVIEDFHSYPVDRGLY